MGLGPGGADCPAGGGGGLLGQYESRWTQPERKHTRKKVRTALAMPCRVTHRIGGRRGGPSVRRRRGGLRRTILRPRQLFRGDLTKVEGTYGRQRHGIGTSCRVTPRLQNRPPLRGRPTGLTQPTSQRGPSPARSTISVSSTSSRGRPQPPPTCAPPPPHRRPAK